MDDDLKHLRVSFSGVRQEDRRGRGETMPVPSSQQRTSSRRGPMSNAAEEYDAAYAATVAAVAYAIAAREERLLASQSQGRPPYAAADKLAPRGNGNKQQRRPPAASAMDEPAARTTTPQQSGKSPRTPKRGESLKKPIFEGGRSSSSRWLTGKEPVDDDYQDEQANVSVNRPLRPAQKKPGAEGGAISDERPPAFTDPAPRVRKDPSFTRKPSEKRGSRRFEQDQGNQTTAPQPPPPVARPMDKTTSSSWYPAAGRESGGAATATTSGGAGVTTFSSENEAMADAWEKEKLKKIKNQYNETMQTIAEWEAEKKAKARRQKQLKDESESERKRAKALEEYNQEMARINKVAAASRLTADEKKRNAERKVRDKAHTIRATGKLPGTCGCF